MRGQRTRPIILNSVSVAPPNLPGSFYFTSLRACVFAGFVCVHACLPALDACALLTVCARVFIWLWLISERLCQLFWLEFFFYSFFVLPTRMYVCEPFCSKFIADIFIFTFLRTQLRIRNALIAPEVVPPSKCLTYAHRCTSAHTFPPMNKGSTLTYIPVCMCMDLYVYVCVYPPYPYVQIMYSCFM